MSNRPTHLHRTGAIVFPQGYAKRDLKPLPDGYWEERDEAAAWAALRAERNRRLAEHDLAIGLPDFPISAERREALLIYRQALRDLPANADPASPEWPKPPKD